MYIYMYVSGFVRLFSPVSPPTSLFLPSFLFPHPPSHPISIPLPLSVCRGIDEEELEKLKKSYNNTDGNQRCVWWFLPFRYFRSSACTIERARGKPPLSRLGLVLAHTTRLRTKRNERGGTYTQRRKKGESYLPTRPLALIG